MGSIGRNAKCPCGTGKKYKDCCRGTIDWDRTIKDPKATIANLRTRGRNILFLNRIFDILQLDSWPVDRLPDYKSAFTADKVRTIHEAVIESWPPDLNVHSALQKERVDVSGLYIGDYNPEYLARGLVRHSIYANKMLIVDPFIYPLSVRDEYNPILEPAQHRAQTLKNVNFWLSFAPWIEAGLVDIIRTPADFDQRLNWESMKRQKKKFEKNPELMEAAERTADELHGRHYENEIQRVFLLGAPESYVRQLLRESGAVESEAEEEEFIRYVRKLRESDPNILDPSDVELQAGQLMTTSTGASYDVAQLTASLTQSYLVTDLPAKWKEIELDRESNNAHNRVWSPFAKAMQQSQLNYLNSVRLEHALKLRKEGRLESFRAFLNRVWKSARTEDAFGDENAILLSEELRDEVKKANDEWEKINQDLIKISGGEIATGLLAAGPLIASGHGAFLAAAAATVGATTLGATYYRRRKFPDRFPAAFFMRVTK